MRLHENPKALYKPNKSIIIQSTAVGVKLPKGLTPDGRRYNQTWISRMFRDHATTSAPIRNLAGRMVWLALAVAHAPGCFRAAGLAGGEFDFLRLLILSASLAFFVLKILDVAWLRFPPSRRFWLVLCASVVLLHADVMRRTAAVALEAAEPAVPMVLAAALVVLARRMHVRSTSGFLWFERRARAALASLLDATYLSELPHRFLLLECGCPIDRAPPAR